MSKLIDLSHNITNDMPVHPYDDQVKLNQNKYLLKDKYNSFRLETGMHSGTHIDSPMHLLDTTTFINDLPLDNFIGEGTLLDVRNEKTVEFKPFYKEKVRKDDIVLLYTGHSNKYDTKEYYENYPILSGRLVDFFINKNIKMLGIDLPSPDNYPFDIHKKLLKKHILIIENLTNLSKLLNIENFTIIAFPLKIRAEASITRVVAKVGN